MKSKSLYLYNGKHEDIGGKMVMLCGWNQPGCVTLKVVKDRREFSVSGKHQEVKIGDKIKGLRGGYRVDSVEHRPFDDDDSNMPTGALVRVRLTR